MSDDSTADEVHRQIWRGYARMHPYLMHVAVNNALLARLIGDILGRDGLVEPFQTNSPDASTNEPDTSGGGAAEIDASVQVSPRADIVNGDHNALGSVVDPIALS